MCLILGHILQSGLPWLHKQILKFGHLSTETTNKMMVFSKLFINSRDMIPVLHILHTILFREATAC